MSQDNTSRRRNEDVVLQAIANLDKRMVERFDAQDKFIAVKFAAIEATTADHEERLRNVENSQRRGVLADGGTLAFSGIIGLANYILAHLK